MKCILKPNFDCIQSKSLFNKLISIKYINIKLVKLKLKKLS